MISVGRKLTSLLAALLVGFLLPGIASPALAQQGSPVRAQQEQQPKGATLRVGLQQQIDSLNPFLGYTLAATDIFRSIYPTLTTYSPKDFSPQGELAESWKVSDDKLTWTFRIRDGVTWSDGKPVTAEDAAYTYNRIMHDPVAATANGNFVESFTKVEAPDPHTLVIHTKSPQATMLGIDIPIVPKHIWSQVRDLENFANDQTPIVGSGPFVLTEYEREQHVTLRAKEDHWRGAPKVSEVQFIQFKNSDAAVQALRKGDIDVAQQLTPTQFDALREESDIKTVRGQGRRFYEMILNPGATNSENAPIGTGHPALQDVRVRRAIDRAIDKETLVSKVLGGYGQVGAGYLPPIFDDYFWRPPKDQQRSFDLQAANRMLDEAGYERGSDGIRHTPRGEPLEFDFVLHGEKSEDAQVGEFVKRWLSDLGIKVELQPVSDSQLQDRTTAGDFDMVISGWSANPDPDYVLRLQTCGARPDPGGGGMPDTFLCDKTYDRLYQQQLAEFDPAKRQEVVKKAQQRFHDQAAGLILFYQNSLEAYRSDRYSGFTLQPSNQGVITAQQGYWGYYEAQPTEKALSDSASTNYGTAALVLVGVVVVGGGLVGLVSYRRRANLDDRE